VIRRALLLLLLTAAAHAATPNLAGKYTSTPVKPGAPPTTVLDVTQSGTALAITRTERGRTTTSHFVLGGAPGPYTSPGGVAGKGRAKFDGDTLLIDSQVENRPQPTAAPVQLRIMEKWTLAPDHHALSIAFEVAFPNMPGARPQSWTEDYTRK
jgi:hypothetical protein